MRKERRKNALRMHDERQWQVVETHFVSKRFARTKNLEVRVRKLILCY